MEAEIRKDDNKVRTSRGISKEVWEARPYTRWTKAHRLFSKGPLIRGTVAKHALRGDWMYVTSNDTAAPISVSPARALENGEARIRRIDEFGGGKGPDKKRFIRFERGGPAGGDSIPDGRDSKEKMLSPSDLHTYGLPTPATPYFLGNSKNTEDRIHKGDALQGEKMPSLLSLVSERLI